MEQYGTYGAFVVSKKQFGPQLAAHVQNVVLKDAPSQRNEGKEVAEGHRAVDVELAGLSVEAHLARMAGQVAKAVRPGFFAGASVDAGDERPGGS